MKVIVKSPLTPEETIVINNLWKEIKLRKKEINELIRHRKLPRTSHVPHVPHSRHHKSKNSLYLILGLFVVSLIIFIIFILLVK